MCSIAARLLCYLFNFIPMRLFDKKTIAGIMADSEKGEYKLRRTLGPVNLIALGIGAIIGAGLFSLTGIAAAQNSGPAVALSMVVAAIGCAFAGLCYSEFSCMIPVAGSAYTYCLYHPRRVDRLDHRLGPRAGVRRGRLHRLHQLVGLRGLAAQGCRASTCRRSWSPGRSSRSSCPTAAVIHGIINLPAVFIITVISLLLMLGIKESARANGVIVVIKLAVVLVFIGIGWMYIDKANYTPFIPANTGIFGHFGFSGIMAGAGTIFFAYIGFDAVSTAAQEARNPQRDMPIGIIGSLIICTILYVLFSVVLTGMVSYTQLGVAAPVALAIDKTPYLWLNKLVKLGIIAGFTSVILVMLLGQSRVFFSMSRDGLVPKVFSAIHPRFRTPWRSNLLFCLFVAPFSAFLPLSVVGHMTSIGTLFAFVIVCAGVWVMRVKNPEAPRPFKTPWVPLIPALGIVWNFAMMYSLGWDNWMRLGVWFLVGQILYFAYGYKHSHLRKAGTTR